MTYDVLTALNTTAVISTDVSSGSRLYGETPGKTNRYNFSTKFAISDIIITNVYNLKSTETKPITWRGHEPHVLYS